MVRLSPCLLAASGALLVLVGATSVAQAQVETAPFVQRSSDQLALGKGGRTARAREERTMIERGVTRSFEKTRLRSGASMRMEDRYSEVERTRARGLKRERPRRTLERATASMKRFMSERTLLVRSGEHSFLRDAAELRGREQARHRRAARNRRLRFGWSTRRTEPRSQLRGRLDAQRR